MRNSLKAVLTPALLAATAFGQATAPEPATAGPAALPAVGTYAIDPVHTFVYFAAKHLVVGMVRGRFDKMSGTLVVAPNPADCNVDVTIETGTVSTQNSVRDEDLRSDAYFDVAKYPAATYRGHGIHRLGDGWVMDGTLTIRGASRLVPLRFRFTGTAPPQAGKPNRVAFQATAATKRAEFNMTRDLLAELGVSFTGPDVWLEIDAEALAAGTGKL